MPKILRIIHRFVLSGPMLNAVLLSEHLNPDFETLLIGGVGEEGEANAEFIFKEQGIPYVKIEEMSRSISPLMDWKAYLKIKSIIKDFQPDIVHTHAAKAGTLGRLAAINSGVPVVLHTFHGHVFHSYFGNLKTRFFIKIEQFLAARSTKIVAISQLQKRELSKDFKICPAKKIEIVPLGFNLDKFLDQQPEKRIAFRQEFDLKQEEIVVGIVGRLVPIKNHILFINAIFEVQKNTTKKIKYFIVGGGETQEELESLLTEFNISFSTPKQKDYTATVIFTSWRTDVDVILAGVDIVALTSLNEGTPVSLIEAQAAGKPIVSTNVGGIEDVVEKGESALLSPSKQVKPFAKNLLYLIENATIRKKMGGAARSKVMKKFGYQRLVEDLKKLYNELLNEN